MAFCYYVYYPTFQDYSLREDDEALAARKIFWSKASAREYARTLKLRYPFYKIEKCPLGKRRRYVAC